MRSSITLVALLYGFVNSLPQGLTIPGAGGTGILFPVVQGTTLDADICNFNADGWKGATLIPSNLTASYEASSTDAVPACPAPNVATSRYRRSVTETSSQVQRSEKRSAVVCQIDAKLTFGNLPYQGPWMTPEPRFFPAGKQLTLSWSPGAVVSEIRVWKVGGAFYKNYGIPALAEQNCQPTPLDGGAQEPFSFVVAPEAAGFLFFEIQFAQIDEKAKELVLFDVTLG